MSEQENLTTPTPQPPPGESSETPKVFVDENEWLSTQTELAELKGYKKGRQEEAELRLGQPHPEVVTPTPPAPAPRPEFQYHSDAELDKAIEGGDLKSYHRLSTHNNETKRQEDLWELKTKEIEPLRQTGSQALSDLSGKLASQNMPHLDIPEVKRTYEERMQSMKASGQVVTGEVHQNLYEWAVGSNITKVQEKIQQVMLRDQEVEANTPTAVTGREAGGGEVEIPSPETFFEREAIQKLEQKYQGLSPRQAVDREFARHGGWEGYYKKFYGPKKEGEK